MVGLFEKIGLLAINENHVLFKETNYYEVSRLHGIVVVVCIPRMKDA